MKITLRKFTSEDTPVLATLFHDTVHQINGKDYPPEQLDAMAPAVPDLKRWRQQLKAAQAIVAESGGKIVGFGNAGNDPSAIGMICVHKDFQGQGVASLLLRKLERRMIKAGQSIATAEVNLTARSYFEKRGYRLVKETKSMLNGSEFRKFEMEKILPLKESKEMKDREKKKHGIRWGDLLVNKFFDLLMVIIGVTIAFQLNNLKLESDQAALGRFYYESLLTDIDEDLKDYEAIVKSLESNRQLAGSYLRKLEIPDAAPDSLGTVIVHLMSLESFSGNENTYRTLVSSNGLTALQDRSVRRQITEYYSQYGYISRFEKVHTELIMQFLGYVSPFCDIAAQTIVDDTILRNVRTKNFLVIFVRSLSTGIEDYGEAEKQARELRRTVQAKLD